MRESEIERYFIWAVAMKGGKTYKFRSVTQNGVADRIACLPNGDTWYVELKAPGGKMEPLQIEFQNEMRRLNQLHACLSTIEEVDQWMKNL